MYSYINSNGFVTPVSSAGDARFTHRWNGSSAVAQGILIEERRGNYHWLSDVPDISTWNGGATSATWSTSSETLPTGSSGNCVKAVVAAGTSTFVYKYHTKWADLPSFAVRTMLGAVFCQKNFDIRFEVQIFHWERWRWQ